MRPFTICLLLVVALLAVSCAKKPAEKLVGEWKGTDSLGDTASFVFRADQSCQLMQGNRVLDGPALGGKLEWRLDSSHDPMSLDAVLIRGDKQIRLMTMIVRFVTDQKVLLRFNQADPQSRPTAFSLEETPDQIVLTKQ